jgi:hypothetical protein
MGAIRAGPPSQRPLRVSEWVLGIVGGITAFLGLFILFGGEDQSIGIGGDVSWRVGDIAIGWGYGLLAAGIVAGAVVFWLVRRDRRLPASSAREPLDHADLYVHAVVFLLVNAFIWAQDIVIGDGLNYALWVTIPWGVGLAIHALSEFGGTPRAPLPH